MLNSNTISQGADPATVFAALGDHTRLSLLKRLSDGKTRSITGLSANTVLTRQAVTKHLRVLENVGLVVRNHVGRESQYTYRPEPIVELKTYLNGISQQWDDALLRLRSFVER